MIHMTWKSIWQNRVRRWSVVAAVFVTAAVIWGVREQPILAVATQPSEKASPPAPRQYVSSLGRLEPRGTVVTVAAPSATAGAVVEELHVHEGQTVKKGDLLATLDSCERQRAVVEVAQSQLAVAQSVLQQVEAGAKKGDIDAQEAMVARADAELEKADRELERAKSLSARNVLPAEEIETRQLTADRARIETQRERARLISLKEVREVDLNVRRAEVAAARAEITRASAELRSHRIVAPSDGQILRLHAYPGEVIGDDGLLQLGDVRHMQAVAEVYEGDVPLVRLGQVAEITVESLGLKLKGTVAELGWMIARKDVLSNDPVSDTDARVQEIRIDLDPAAAEEVARLSNARVEIIIDVRKPAAK